MTQKLFKILPLFVVMTLLAALVSTAGAQSGSQGSIAVAVADSSGGLVPQAALELVDLATNDVRKASSRENGAYTFVNLAIGNYKLTVSRKGYQSTVLESILVHASQVTDISVVLKVGSSNETVTVNATATPLVESSSSMIGTIVDLKQIEDLPMTGRDLTALATLTPGYSGDNGGSGQWNGQPMISQGSNIDGTVGASSRMKMWGNVEPAVEPRIEDIEEMSVETDQLDLDQGFGIATMQVNFVTRRGTNTFHGRVYDNFHNNGLNANSWTNNAEGVRHAKSIYNDFGGSAGGRILRDKLFFFASFAEEYIPGGSNVSNSLLTSNAQSGQFTYTGTDGNAHTINLLDVAHKYSSKLTSSVNSAIATQLGIISTAAKEGTVTSSSSDANFNTVTWYNQNNNTTYYPVARIDYNLSQKVRMGLTWSMTYNVQPGVNQAPYPGSAFAGIGSGNKTKNYSSSYSLDWDVSPQVINQFKLGFLYNANFYSYNAKQLYRTEPTVSWVYNSSTGGSIPSGQSYGSPITQYQPIFNASDVVTLQRSRHTFKAGFTAYREQDHYWNAPTGFPSYTLGMADADTANNAFTTSPSSSSCDGTGTVPCASSSTLTEAAGFYAVLAGRVSGIGSSEPYVASTNGYPSPGTVGSWALNELASAWGMFAQDAFRIKPSLTLNFGLRWDFTGQSKDLNGVYHNADPSSVYGPTAKNDLFKPGTLSGNMNPTLVARPRAYDPFHVTPQPAVGLAWNPKVTGGMFEKLTGGDKTVIRAGYSLRRFTEPYQYYWNNVSDQGSFFYQSYSLTANNTGTKGTFTPGSLTWDGTGDSMPTNYLLSPTSYAKSVPISDFTFLGNCPGCSSPGVTGIDNHIKQPYTQSWNLGIQRQFGSRVLEIRYAGNHSLHQWVNDNTNEVNIFENGFLSEFKKAQANLTAYQTAHPDCASSGTCSFANNGLSGQSSLPILNAAFAGESYVSADIPLSDYANSTFLTYLETGQAGAMAGSLSGIGTTTYLCNLVGSSFTPCGNNAGYTGGTGAGKPINFFQANPYAAGYQTQYMNAAGYSNYHSLQLELRQQQWQGLQYDLNYTWAHNLGYGVNTNGPGGVTCGGYDGWCAWPDTITLRNRRAAYGPTQYDIRHVFHFNGTYDLPIGPGKRWLSANNLASRILGNWTIGTILTYQSGTPQELSSGNLTFNDYGDGGVKLTNITVRQLQKAVGVHRVPGKIYALLIDPKYLAASDGSGAANSTYIAPNTTPGTYIHPIYLFGPHALYNDLALSKSFPIHKQYKMKLQAEATNVWNHPVFGNTSGSFGGYPTYAGGNIQSSGWGTSSVTNGARVIEFRGNIEF